MKITTLLLLFVPLVGCRPAAPTAVHAAENGPSSWFITDLGTEVVYDDGLDGIVSAEGMWYATSSIKAKQLIAPIAVKIQCGAGVHVCRESGATIAMGILKPDTTDYTISVWNKERIVAEDTDEHSCKITHRLVVDLMSKTVTLTDLPSQVMSNKCKYYRDANSYILHGGSVMLIPSPSYEPLAKAK